jgi:hypothetical protein
MALRQATQTDIGRPVSPATSSPATPRPGRAGAGSYRALVDAAAVALAIGAAQLVVVLQGAAPIPVRWLVAFGILSFLVLQVASRERVPSLLVDVRAVLIAVALAAVAVLTLRVLFAFEPGISIDIVRMSAFVAVYLVAGRAALAWLASERQAARPEEQAPPEAEGLPASPPFEVVAARELARARRHSHPLTLLAFRLRRGSVLELAERRRELHALVAPLSDALRLTDAAGVFQGRVLAILPETGRADAAGALARLREALAPEIVDQLDVGAAFFPDEEITLVGLCERALALTAPLAAGERMHAELLAQAREASG